MNKIVSLILAAGSSTRMGQPKQLLKWGDHTLLDHAIETVLEANTHEVILVLGSNFELINKTIKNHDVTILNNKNWKQGLGTSIACGVQFISKSIPNIDGVLLVLADQPLIDSHYLKSMIKNFVPNNKQILATLYNNGKQGVPVLFDIGYIEELSKLDNDFGAKQLLNKHPSHVVTLGSSIQTVDLDSEEDYKREYHLKFKK